MPSHAVHIGQHWSHDNIVLSYIISATGSFCTIQLLEQWRQYDDKHSKVFLMALSSLALGGCGIWCTHFTGMNALQLVLDDGTALEMHYELGMTILSFLFPFAALFSRLWHILVGGLFAALGVLGMHYLGMSAQRSNATITFNLSIVLVSCVIAFATATAAVLIIFRALTFWPNYESLRLASALIMGIAVCGTHYTGMGAAVYTHNDEDYAAKTRFMIDGAGAAVIASHGSILICYWFTSLGVIKSVKITEVLTRSRHEERVSHNQPANTAPSTGKKETNGMARGAMPGHTLVFPDRSKVYMDTSKAKTELQDS